MFLPIYLAITPQEFPRFCNLPSTLCFSACQFSSSGHGLTSLPSTLPAGSIISINDSLPICQHSPIKVCKQILELVERFRPAGILLDFQRPNNPHTSHMVKAILECTDCPVAVSHIYAKPYSCPVFLPPLPFRTTLKDYLYPWKGREIWMEIGNDKEMAIITRDDFVIEPIKEIPNAISNFRDYPLLCHYCIHIKQGQICFYFQRTKQDIMDLQLQATRLGVSKFIGLWQQLQQFYL